MSYPVTVQFGGGQVCKIVLRGYLNRQIFLNVFYYASDAADAPADYLTLLLAWYNDAVSVYTPAMNNQAWVSDATFKIFSVAGVPVTPTLFMPPVQNFGTGGATPMPAQACGLITRRVLRLTNANRGRLYIPFPYTGAGSTAETPSGAYQSKCQAIADLLLPLTAVYLNTGQHWAPILLNERTGSWQELFATEVQPKWATQKRRGDYGKLNN